MPHFSYRATNAQGKIISGTLEMVSEASLRAHLRSQGLMLLKVEEKTKQSDSRKLHIKQDQLSLFTSQLAELLKASLPLDQSLEALEEQTDNGELKALIATMKEKIRRGASFSEVLGDYPTIFPPLYRACIEAGESIGSIGDAVSRMNLLLTSRLHLKQKLTSLLLYPVLLFGLLITAILILSFFVLPSLEGLFEGKALPTFTALVFGMSHILQRYWDVGLLLFLFILLGAWYFLKKPEVEVSMSRKILAWPFVGRFILLSALSRFSTTLSLLLQGGIPLVKALELSKEAIRNHALRDEIQTTIDELVHGEKLSTMFKRSKLLPPLMGRFAYLGEETGKLAQLFNHIGVLYEEESSRSLENAVSLLQPVLLIIMGMVIGTTILSILLPLSDFGSVMAL